jgi:hypothetical protein
MTELSPTASIESLIVAGLSPTRDEVKASTTARKAALARASSGRRRFVDPATCERDYSVAEMEFLGAMQEYKRSSGRMFPTWSEVLEVVRTLGYEKVGT